MSDTACSRWIEGFDTERLRVRHWGAALQDRAQGAVLKQEILPLLTADVLEHLPDTLALPEGDDGINQWVADRAAAADVYTIRLRADAKLLGLLFLFAAPDTDLDKGGAAPTQHVHVGYLFGQASWGNGYATEMLNGLVAQRSKPDAPKLRAGVDVQNPASSRVLLKCGFHKVAALSSPDIEIFEL